MENRKLLLRDRLQNMTIYELLACNKNLIEVMINNNINHRDIQHLEMYNEYRKLKAKGVKISYIVACVAIQYDMTERNVYRIINRLEKKLSIN